MSRRARYLRFIGLLALGQLAGQALVTLVLVSLFLVLGATVAREMLLIDRMSTLWLAELANPALTAAMLLITSLGDGLTATALFLLMIGVLIRQQRYGMGMLVGVSGLGAAAIGGLTKAAYARARPDLIEPLAAASGYSFPSGHTLAAVITFGLLAYLGGRGRCRSQRQLLAATALLLVALVGLSRIYLGVHFVSDVVGSLLVGGAWLLVSITALQRAARRRASAGS